MFADVSVSFAPKEKDMTPEEVGSQRTTETQKPSNRAFELARIRFRENWVDLSPSEKISVLLDLIDELGEVKKENEALRKINKLAIEALKQEGLT